MFRSVKNLDTAFRQTRTFALAVSIGSLLLAGLISLKSFSLASETQQKIYVLANGKALEAFAADRKDNVPVEAKDHVKVFHQLFFTLSPDEKVIMENITRALYLADESAKREYDNLKENNFYGNLISGNVNQSIRIDNIHIDVNQYPIFFRCTATQQITRSTTEVHRSLTTEGFLRNVPRSDNNPHGFLIERWKIIENKDVNVIKR